jgi:hypothetical protein
VVGELGHRGIRVRLEDPLERLADPAVELHAAGAGELRVQGLADERVREAVAPLRVRRLGHDLALDRLLDRVDQLRAGLAVQALEHVEVELAADGRRQRQDLVCLL